MIMSSTRTERGQRTMIKPKFYKQCSPKWNTWTWNGASVCRNGCGPSSIANAVAVLKKLGHTKATPLSVFKWICRHGYMHPTMGTYYSGITATLKAYGVKDKDIIHSSNFATLKSHLKKGDFAVCLCGNSRWTKSGHYILAYYCDKDNNVYISDGASSDPSRAKAKFAILKAAIKAHPYPQFWIINNTASYLNKKSTVPKKTDTKKTDTKKDTAKNDTSKKTNTNTSTKKKTTKKKKRVYPELPKRGYFKTGDKGVNVKRLQTLLNKAGFKCGKVDGIYGDKTARAVKRLQQKYNITPDGLAGRKTVNALKKALN